MAGYGSGGVGGGGYAGPRGQAPSSATTPGSTAAPAQQTPAQQINALTAEIGRLQATNPAPNSPTYSYLQGLQAQVDALMRSQQPAANSTNSMFKPGQATPMQQDNNRSLQDLAQNGAGRAIGAIRGLDQVQTQSANVAAGRTPMGQSIEAPKIEGPSQKSLYSFVPSAAQNNPGLDQSYLSFLQQVFNQNRFNPAMNGSNGTPTAGLGTGAVSGVRG